MKRRLSGSAIGLIVLTVVVAALVGFAVRTPSPPDETANVGPSALPISPSESAPTETSTSGVDSPPPATSPAESDARVLLSTTTRNGPAARGLVGSCESEAAVLELSDDGGSTWEEVDVPARGLLRVKAVGDGETWVVGTDEGCQPRFIRTTDGGETWATNEGTDGAWHLLPGGAEQLHAPDGNLDSPCRAETPALDLAAVNDQVAAVLCAAGRVHTTDDSGATWERMGAVEEGTAIAFSNASIGYAAVPDDRCDGTRVWRTTDGGSTWDERGCVEGAADGVGLAFSSRTVGLLATIDESWLTEDAGRTWTRL